MWQNDFVSHILDFRKVLPCTPNSPRLWVEVGRLGPQSGTLRCSEMWDTPYLPFLLLTKPTMDISIQTTIIAVVVLTMLYMMYSKFMARLNFFETNLQNQFEGRDTLYAVYSKHDIIYQNSLYRKATDKAIEYNKSEEYQKKLTALKKVLKKEQIGKKSWQPSEDLKRISMSFTEKQTEADIEKHALESVIEANIKALNGGDISKIRKETDEKISVSAQFAMYDEAFEDWVKGIKKN